MKPKDLFGVAVRVVALYFIVQGLYRFMQVLDVAIPIVTGDMRLEQRERFQIGVYVFSGILHFALSFGFMRGAEWFTKLAYPSIEKIDA